MFEEVRRCNENCNKVEKRGLNNIGSSKYESCEEETSSTATTTSPSTKSGSDATYAEFTFPSIDASTSKESISSSGSVGSLLYNTYEPVDLSRALIDMTKEHICKFLFVVIYLGLVKIYFFTSHLFFNVMMDICG